MQPSKSRMRAVAAAVGFLVAVPCSLAAAQPDQPSQTDKATARRLMDLGDQKAKQGDLKGALEAYKGADGIMKVPTTGLEVGKLQHKLGLLIEAADTLSRVRRYKHPAGETEPDAYAAARAEATTLATVVEQATPEVTLAPSGLAEGVKPQVTIDGEPVAANLLLLPRRLNPGSHKLVATAPGYKPIEQPFKLSEKQKLTLPLSFEPAAGATEPAPGPAVIPPGPPDPPPEVPSDVPSDRGGLTTQRTLALVSAGVGVAGIVVGGVLGAKASSAWDEAQEHCDQGSPKHCDPQGVSLAGDAMSLGNGATVGFVVGGVGLAGAAVLWLTAGSPTEPSSATRFLPSFGPNGASLSLKGSF